MNRYQPRIPSASALGVHQRLVYGDCEYDNIHKLYVQRPESFRGFLVWYDPIMKWGRVDTGISYGSIAHTAFGGENLFTGVLTDSVNRVSITIEDGAIIKGWESIDTPPSTP